MPSRRRNKQYCLACKTEIIMKNGKYNKIFCSKKCSVSYRIGDRHACWKGGVYIDGSGYAHVYSPTHPYKSAIGYVKRSRLEVEKNIGRYLSRNEVVHHINRDKSDDRIDNLKVMSNTDHMRFHATTDKTYRYIAIPKFERHEIIPQEVVIGKIISVGKEYRTFIGVACSLCKKEFWSRKDKEVKVCKRCVAKYGWINGKYKNRKKRCQKLQLHTNLS